MRSTKYEVRSGKYEVGNANKFKNITVNILRIVEKNKASQGLRFANYIVDLIAFYVLMIIFFSIIGSFLSDPDALIDRLDKINPLLDRLLSLIFYAIYMLIIEVILKGRSLGKFITGTKVMMIDGTAPTLSHYFTRNISRAVPFDQLSFFGTNGWHDSWSDTRVVKITDYENDIKLQKDLESLGKEESA